MSNILTIISEYNPFHSGHLYHIKKTQEMISADYKIAIISGNFVQRGEPSILNKWEKTKVILSNGFDMVIELPCIYAISSAENFANGAIKIANQINATHLSFGSEIGKIDSLKEVLSLISENQEEYDKKVKERLAEGNSYPKSQELAIEELFSGDYKSICSPNNILGLEYLKALKNTNSSITPVTIKRIAKYVSSAKIRTFLRKNNIEKLKDLNVVPESSYSILSNNINQGHSVFSLKEYEKEIIYTLRKMSLEDLKNVPDIPDNLLGKFKIASDSCNSIEKLIQSLKNKSITQARIQRILLYILLGITKQDMEMSKVVTPYVRVLGITTKGKKLLSTISETAPNLITSVKTFENTCKDKNLIRMLEIDKFATDVYTLAYKKDSTSHLDYTTKLIEKI